MPRRYFVMNNAARWTIADIISPMSARHLLILRDLCGSEMPRPSWHIKQIELTHELYQLHQGADCALKTFGGSVPLPSRALYYWDDLSGLGGNWVDGSAAQEN